MKISELIAKLRQVHEFLGDYEVVVAEYEFYTDREINGIEMGDERELDRETGKTINTEKKVLRIT